MRECILIINANIVNEGERFEGCVFIEDGIISEIIKKESNQQIPKTRNVIIIDAKGKLLIPGIIDTHVHFREPGLTHKGDIYTESKAAVAGGVTSYFDMPNTIPNAINSEIIEQKAAIAKEKSLANYSFYIGASNDNFEDLFNVNPEEVCGVKLFMGASTGNMLVDKEETLNKIFSEIKLPVCVHCEDESIIRKNTEYYKNKYSDDIPVNLHSIIRSEEACYKSTLYAIELARKYNTRMNVMHLSTGKETKLFDCETSVAEKRITSETCIHYLFFDENDYSTLGTLIKCNPSINGVTDKIKLLKSVNNGKIDIISSDHAPHLSEEKKNKYLKSPSGIPLVQHTLVAMLEFYHKGLMSIEKIIETMCHNPAICYSIEKRGFIRKGYNADLAIVDLDSPWYVDKSNIYYKCNWSPFEGFKFKSKVTHTFVNGHLVYHNGEFDESMKGERIRFKRSYKL